MTERERVVRICRELGLPANQYVVNGSGSMIMQGVERHRPMGDLDIFCSTRLWFELLTEFSGWKLDTPSPHDKTARCGPPILTKDMFGLRVDICFDSDRRSLGTFNPSLCMHNAEFVQGVPCVPLEFVLAWKNEVGRSKDLEDIETLKKVLGL